MKLLDEINNINKTSERLLKQIKKLMKTSGLSEYDLETLDLASKQLEKTSKHANKAYKLVKGSKLANVDEMKYIQATLKKSNAFDCKVLVNEDRHFVLLKDSIICIGYLPKESSKFWAQLRHTAIHKGYIKRVNLDNFKSTKYLLTKNLYFESEVDLRQFILGRDMNIHDKDVNLMVGNLTLSDYIKSNNN